MNRGFDMCFVGFASDIENMLIQMWLLVLIVINPAICSNI
jgi:hypothetical protein